MKLKRSLGFLAATLVFCGMANAQNNSAALETVLKKMDTAAANFRTTTADFQWDQFTRVIGSTDTQAGKIYFRRNGKNIEMLADVQSAGGKPEPKQVLFTDSKLRLYELPIAYYGRTYAEGKKITWRDGFKAIRVLLSIRLFG